MCFTMKKIHIGNVIGVYVISSNSSTGIFLDCVTGSAPRIWTETTIAGRKNFFLFRTKSLDALSFEKLEFIRKILAW